MSWLSGIAKGAEALLDKMDQTAATALQNDGSKPKDILQDQTDGRASQAIHDSIKKEANPVISSVMPDLVSRQLSGPTKAVSTGAKVISRSSSATNMRPKSDAHLFEFLNSVSSTNNPQDKNNFPLTSTPIRSKVGANRAVSSAVSVPKAMDMEQPLKNSEISEAPASMPNLGDLQAKIPDAEKVVIIDKNIVDEKPLDDTNVVDVMKPEPTEKKNKEKNDRISNLQLENKLLKSEISSLNEELASSIKRAQELQNEFRHMEEKLSHAQHQMAQQDKMMFQIQEHDKDLNEAIKAKDSQLAVLRVRIEEADDDARSRSELIKKLTSENERVLKDHSDSSGMHNVALDAIKDKLIEKEKELEVAKIEHNKAQEELIELRSKLQTDQNQMAESIKSMQLKQSEERERFKDMERSLRLAKDSADVAQRDLKEYKDKATRILQAKEKLITSLKQGTSNTDASPAVFTELEEMRQERDLLREDLQQLKYKFEQLRMEMSEMEHQSQTDAEEQQNHIDHLEKTLQDEKNKRQHCEEEVTQNLEELRLLKEDLQRQKLKTSAIIQEKESEIQQLNQQAHYRTSIIPSQEELENRIHSLTDNLIQKQSIIETLSTEKNSLSLQLERLEQQYRDVQHNLSKSTAHLRQTHHMDLEDSEEANVNSGSIASIMPYSVTKSRRWKSTVNVIDKFSIRLGVFLRRYPIARLFVIVYVFILHLWVTIVLLTYQPEIHKNDPKLPSPSR